MDAETRERVLQELVPLGLHRSVGVPTLRFGRPATVIVTGGLSEEGAPPREPLHWIVVDAASGDLHAVARCSVATPLPGWTAPAETDWADPPAGSTASGELWRRACDAFLAGGSIPADERSQVEAALLVSVQDDLRDWLFDCCSDFMDWLAGDAGGRP